MRKLINKCNPKILLFFVIISFSLVTESVNAQLARANNWAFGNGRRYVFPGPAGGTSQLTTLEGGSTASDATGALDMHTDGRNVWVNWGGGPVSDLLAPCALNSSSTQNGLIIPNPIGNGQYFILSVSSGGGGCGGYNNGNKLWVTRVNGAGGIVNSRLAASNAVPIDWANNNIAEAMAAVISCDGSKYYVAVHRSQLNGFVNHNMYFIFSIDNAGVSAALSDSYDEPSFQNWSWTAGQMKFSDLGTYLAYTNTSQGTLIMSFDNGSGGSPGQVTGTIVSDASFTGYGLEFSPNEMEVYANRIGGSPQMVQYDLCSGGTKTTMIAGAASNGGSMQLAPDGKIYFVYSSATEWMGVINNPNTVGAGAGVNTSLQKGFFDLISTFPEHTPTPEFSLECESEV